MKRPTTDVVAEFERGPLRAIIETFRPEYEAHELLKTEGVKRRYEKLLEAVDRLPGRAKTAVGQLTHHADYQLWKIHKDMPTQLKKLLELDADKPLTFSEYVFGDTVE